MEFLEKADVGNTLIGMVKNTTIDLGNGQQTRNGYMGLVIYIANLLNQDDDFSMSDLFTDEFQDFIDDHIQD